MGLFDDRIATANKDNGVRLWQADPHEWGNGKVHALDPEKSDRTYCGRITSAIPGRPISDGQVTCITCIERPVRRQQSVEEQAEKEKQRETEHQKFRERLESYKKTEKWRVLQNKVIERANRLCEGCREQFATEAHHLSYKHIGNEFLWELRAVCSGCHKRFHGEKP